jgi:hypothetical protein
MGVQDTKLKRYADRSQTSYVYQRDVFCAFRHYRFVALVGVQAAAPLGAAPGVAPLAQSAFCLVECYKAVAPLGL